MCFGPQLRALFRHVNFQKRSVTWFVLMCFVHFDLGICFAPQRRALFQHVNFQKLLLVFFTCTCASRHNGVQFVISHLARLLRARRFSEPSFRPSGATNHWKDSASRLSHLFARLDLLSSDCLFFGPLSSSLLLLFPSLLFICPYCHCQKFDF